ncbi:MAG: hypothetical protein LBR67_08575 [Dysgonamonadaceae bacterium]|jgi:hypothetical protein|nr:hypothetical protein [Dysgonamonadaceae bacterium]
MKRSGSLAILLIINILILTFAVIPHHHHRNLPCFKDDVHQHCMHAGLPVGHDAAAPDDGCCEHHHDSDEPVSCAIEDFIIFNDTDVKDILPYTFCLQFHPDTFLSDLFQATNPLLIPESLLLFRLPPYLFTYHPLFVNPGSGLRAPPFC